MKAAKTSIERTFLVTLLVATPATVLVGCSSSQNTYEIAGVMGHMSSSQAEEAQLELSARGRLGSGVTDKPLRLLRAPQPAMPAEDIAKSTTGSVTAVVRFAETGEPESVVIRSSTSESLSNAVVVAMRQWRIEPPTRGGAPTKLTISQTFNFKTGP